MNSKKRIKINHDLKSIQQKIKSKRKKRLRNIAKNNITKAQRKERVIAKRLKHNFKSYKHLYAPTVLSLLDNTEEVVTFIKEIDKCFEKKRNIFVEMTKVLSISYGTIVVLLSKLVQFKSQRLQVNGNFPKNKDVKRMLKESGFIDYLFKEHIEDKNEYYIDDKICTHAKRIADPILSDSVIKKVSKALWGEERRCIGVQRVFLELMQNTNNHASDIMGEKLWWSSIVPVKGHNGEIEKICFSFIDYGIGIFTSLSSKKQGKFVGIVEKIKRLFGNINDAEMMQLLLHGEIHKTATGQSFRGKGLPGIYNAMVKKDISNLKIISNNAYADVANNQFMLMQCEFSGTYVYWELDKSNNNLKI